MTCDAKIDGVTQNLNDPSLETVDQVDTPLNSPEIDGVIISDNQYNPVQGGQYTRGSNAAHRVNTTPSNGTRVCTQEEEARSLRTNITNLFVTEKAALRSDRPEDINFAARQLPTRGKKKSEKVVG